MKVPPTQNRLRNSIMNKINNRYAIQFYQCYGQIYQNCAINIFGIAFCYPVPTTRYQPLGLYLYKGVTNIHIVNV